MGEIADYSSINKDEGVVIFDLKRCLGQLQISHINEEPQDGRSGARGLTYTNENENNEFFKAQISGFTYANMDSTTTDIVAKQQVQVAGPISQAHHAQ